MQNRKTASYTNKGSATSEVALSWDTRGKVPHTKPEAPAATVTSQSEAIDLIKSKTLILTR